MELYLCLKSFVPWLYPYFTAFEDKHASRHSLTVTHPPGTHHPCENPHGHCFEVVVMVEMDGLHVNGVILKPQKLCSMALPIFYNF
jgi:6-pyruvoyl-tetrahydropterin synthase